MTKKYLLGLRTIVSISLIFLLFWLMGDQINQIFYILKRTKILLFILVSLSQFLTMALLGYRLKALLSFQKIYLSIGEAIYLIFISHFWGAFIPSSVGGDIIKIYYTSKKANGFISPFFSVFVDRLIGFLCIISIAVVSLIFWGRSIKNSVAVLIILATLFIFFMLVVLLVYKDIVKRFIPIPYFLKIGKKVERLYSIIDNFKNRMEILIYALCLSLIIQFISIFSCYLLGLSISIEVPFKIFLLLIPVITIVSILPSLGGLGIRESAIVYFFKEFTTPEKAFALSLLFLASSAVVIPIGGIIYAFKPRFKTANPQRR